MEVSGHLGPFLGADALAALDGEVAPQPHDPRPEQERHPETGGDHGEAELADVGEQAAGGEQQGQPHDEEHPAARRARAGPACDGRRRCTPTPARTRARPSALAQTTCGGTSSPKRSKMSSRPTVSNPTAAARSAVGSSSRGGGPSGGGLRSKATAATYAMRPAPLATVSTTAASRSTVGSTPRPAPTPPQTPVSTRSSPERREICRKAQHTVDLGSVTGGHDQVMIACTDGLGHRASPPLNPERPLGAEGHPRLPVPPRAQILGYMDTPSDTDPAPASSPPPPPPPPAGGSAPARRLRRRPEEGHIAGVCAGVADYFRIDPVIVRIAAVVLAISGPGLIAYVLAWMFVPKEDGSAPPTSRGGWSEQNRGTQILGIVLLVVAVSVLWGSWWSPARHWLLPLGLIGLGTWLLLRRDEPPLEAGPVGTPPASTSTTVAASTPVATTAMVPTGWAPTGAEQPIEVDESVVAVRRRARMVTPLVLGTLLLWFGVAAVAGISVETSLAVALSLVGLGFVLGAFVGGTKLLIVPAVLVGAALLVASIADIPLSGPVGQRHWAPRSIADVAGQYELSIGEGTLDLRGLRLEPGDSIEIAASVGVGRLAVLVPTTSRSTSRQRLARATPCCSVRRTPGSACPPNAVLAAAGSAARSCSTCTSGSVRSR